MTVSATILVRNVGDMKFDATFESRSPGVRTKKNVEPGRLVIFSASDVDEFRQKTRGSPDDVRAEVIVTNMGDAAFTMHEISGDVDIIEGTGVDIVPGANHVYSLVPGDGRDGVLKIGCLFSAG